MSGAGAAGAPLTFGQEQHCRALAATPGLRTPLYFTYRVDGPLAPRALVAAVAELVRRHDALRTAIRPTPDGPVQYPLPVPPTGRLITLTTVRADTPEHSERYAAAVLSQDITAGWPDGGYPFRFRLLRFSPTRHALLAVFAHTHIDGRSRDLLQHDLWAGYHRHAGGIPEPEPPMGDHFLAAARDQRARFGARSRTTNAAYWRARLAECPPRCTPEPGPGAGSATTGGFDVGDLAVRGTLLGALRDRCRKWGCTEFQWVTAALAAALFDLTGRRRLAVHLLADGRRIADRRVVGMFATVLPLVVDRPEEPAVLPAAVARELLSAVTCQHVTPELLEGGDGGPLARDVLINSVAPAGVPPPPAASGLDLRPGAYQPRVPRTSREVELTVRSEPAALRLSLLLRPGLFPAANAEKLLGRLVQPPGRWW